jgi:transcriptional regulator GlxA family with amidase domain
MGLDITAKTNKVISEKLEQIVTLTGLRRWFCLLEMLVILSESKDLKPICKTSFIGKNEKEAQRLCLVFDWILNNYTTDLRVTEAAAICNMSENAFSRFFAQRTRKTFSAFVTELRLNKAAKLLKENELPVTEICYECGFNNISNFNRQFLRQYEVNPVKYRKMFLSVLQ